jgi:hypothetical protein
MFLINHFNFCRFSVELKDLLFVKSIGIKEIDESIDASNEHLGSSIDVFNIDYVLDFECKVVFN